jgi:capsular polysaccharide biosynthesis protein
MHWPRRRPRAEFLAESLARALLASKGAPARKLGYWLERDGLALTMPSREIGCMELPKQDDRVAEIAQAAEAAHPAPASTESEGRASAPDPSRPQGNMLAHISMRGNVMGFAGSWLGEPGSGLAIEAIMLSPSAGGPPHLSPAVESQLIYPLDLKTPWISAGHPCGSSGFALSCIGVRFRLTAETAPFFECRYDIAFTDGSRQEDVSGADICLSSSGAAVEAIRLHVVPRAATPFVVLNDLDDTAASGGGEATDKDPNIHLRLLSPAFSTQEPDIRNAALVPPGHWQAMAVSFNRRVFSARPITFRVIEDAIVAGEGIVFDRDFNLVPGTERLMAADDAAKYRDLAKQGREAGMRRLAGMSVVCKTRAPQNFGHFLVDMFPKAWLATRLLTHRHFNYIVHDTDVLGVVREAFAQIGINPFAISVTDNTPVSCEAAIVIDGLTAHGVYQSPISIQALTDLGERFPPSPYQKIFVSRDAQLRPLVNQEAAEAVMRDRGFAIVDPGRMTLPEQISLFKGASTVVGPLGAALTNIAFCPPGSRIVALTAQSFPDTFFWFISQHRGHDYREVRCPIVSGNPADNQSWNVGFSLTDEDLAFLATL